LPANSVITLIKLGKLYPSARTWSTLAFESLWSTRVHRNGPVYKGRRGPLMLSRIVMMARSFV
jgi:hypothetical protein